MIELNKASLRDAYTFVGKLSGKSIAIPNVNIPPMPALAPPGVILNGKKAEGFGEIDSSRGYPDVRSFKRKFGLLLPATNTSMEHELWSIICNNPEPDALMGVGLHTTNVSTPKPQLKTKEDLREYGRQFLSGLKTAADQALLAEPQYMIMGMSLEHIIGGIDEIRASMAEVEAYSGLSWATWHDAANAALNKFGAKRIGLLTPFDKTGTRTRLRCSKRWDTRWLRLSVSPARTPCILPMFRTGPRNGRSLNCWRTIGTRWMRSSNAAPI